MLVRKVFLGIVFNLVCRTETLDRLLGTCFRGKGVRLAGNFSRWNDVKELFEDDVIGRAISEEFYEVATEGVPGTNSLEIDYEAPVGWSSTDDVKKYDSTLLEHFQPNRKASALRVKTSAQGVRAPVTNLVTLVYEYKLEKGKHHTFVVHSIYPGSDVGPLSGDVSGREGQVFFDWNHPGA